MNSRESQKNVVSDEMIMNCIYVLRGQKVMIDADLATLYHMEVSRVRVMAEKNPNRFPGDFMFQLSLEDHASLKQQDGTVVRNLMNNNSRMAFTEQGLAMLSGMFRSNRAITVNIRIIRIFTLIRQVLPDFPELNRELLNFKNHLICHK